MAEGDGDRGMQDPRELRQLLVARWKAVDSGPFFEVTSAPDALTIQLPPDFVAVVREFGGREGFLGSTHLRLYRLDELIALNTSYEVPWLFPEVFVFGSNGGGEAFALLIEDWSVVRVPFLPMIPENVERLAPDFGSFLKRLASSGESAELDPEAVGMEIHETDPICLGRSPTEPKNKIAAPPREHAKLCCAWNRAYREAATERGTAESVEGT